jgi:hypothetical protein
VEARVGGAEEEPTDAEALAGALGQEHVPDVEVERRDDDDAPPPLRQPKRCAYAPGSLLSEHQGFI